MVQTEIRYCPEDTLTKLNCTPPNPTDSVRWMVNSTQQLDSDYQSEHLLTLHCVDSFYLIIDCKPSYNNTIFTCFDATNEMNLTTTLLIIDGLLHFA